MNRAIAFACLALCAIPSQAAIVEIAFDNAGRFVHSGSIAPGKFVELCGKLKRGDRVAWEFDSPQPLDFNIHYHVGEKVEFPERQAGPSRLAGTFEAPVDQHFCWMWKNAGTSEAALAVKMRRP